MSAPLKRFLAELASDPDKLKGYHDDPEAAMQAAGLSDPEKTALRSKDPKAVFDQLADVPPGAPGAPTQLPPGASDPGKLLLQGIVYPYIPQPPTGAPDPSRFLMQGLVFPYVPQPPTGTGPTSVPQSDFNQLKIDPPLFPILPPPMITAFCDPRAAPFGWVPGPCTVVVGPYGTYQIFTFVPATGSPGGTVPGWAGPGAPPWPSWYGGYPKNPYWPAG